MKVFEDAELVAACQYHRLDDDAADDVESVERLYLKCWYAGRDVEKNLVQYANLVPFAKHESSGKLDQPLYEGGCFNDLPEGWLPAGVKEEMHNAVNATVLDFVRFVNEVEGHLACKRIAIERMLEGKMWFNTALAATKPTAHLLCIHHGQAAQELALKWANKAIALHMVLNRQK